MPPSQPWSIPQSPLAPTPIEIPWTNTTLASQDHLRSTNQSGALLPSNGVQRIAAPSLCSARIQDPISGFNGRLPKGPTEANGATPRQDAIRVPRVQGGESS
ncbi:hypothetical protein B296_00035223 [Ensete ventricosum]|uniref:Uncharacterized protein n=1 Tax=Ensete ventricosum TaxID=4639 RepID=A0A426Y8K0_ENSVE|nr:hypothetical protein B296_00035223 [Ensete ventricosum]